MCILRFSFGHHTGPPVLGHTHSLEVGWGTSSFVAVGSGVALRPKVPGVLRESY